MKCRTRLFKTGLCRAKWRPALPNYHV